MSKANQFLKAAVTALAAVPLAKLRETGGALADPGVRALGTSRDDGHQQPKEARMVEGEGRRDGERHEGVTEGEDEIRVRRSEEELVAGTREREAGEVRVRKSVRTDRESVEVPTRHEEVSVERVPVEGESTETQIGEDEVEVPVTEEEMVVEKRPVIKEEVRIKKDVVEDTEVVEEDIRREEIDVEDDTTPRRDV